MDMSLDDYRQTNTFEPVCVAECIQQWNDDSIVKSGSPKVDAVVIDACNFTALGTTHDACSFTVPMLGTPDVPMFPTAAGISNGVHEEEMKACTVTNDNEFPVSSKSACPLAFSEGNLSMYRESMEGNGCSNENNYRDEEKIVQDENYTACKLTPLLLNVYESDSSKYLGRAEGIAPGVENDSSASAKATNNNEFPVSSKSACPLAISEGNLSMYRASMEENCCSENNYHDEEKIVQDENFTACKLTPLLLSVYQSDSSKCLGRAEGITPGVENDSSASAKATKDTGFLVSCTSASPLTVSEVDDIFKFQATTEGNDACVEINDDANHTEEENGNANWDLHFAACTTTPLVCVADNSTCLESIEGKADEANFASDNAAEISQPRERKKSKYLCYPYVNHGKHFEDVASLWESDEIDEAKSPEHISIQHGSSSPLIKCSKRRREPRKVHTDYAKLEKITVPSADLLTQLRMVSCNHLSPHYNRAIDPAELFLSGFRATVFRGLSDSEITGEDEQVGGNEGDANLHTHVRKTRKKKGKKGSDDSDEKLPSGLYNINVNFSPVDSQMDSTPRKRKRKDVTALAPLESNQVTGELRKKRIRKKGTAPGIPCTNGSNVKSISLEVCLQDAGPYVVANVATSPGLCADAMNPDIPAEVHVLQTPEKAKTVTGMHSTDKSSDELSLNQMKHSLELMTSMLEKSSTTVSPDTRAKLEDEIKSLLKKVNPMVNPSF